MELSRPPRQFWGCMLARAFQFPHSTSPLISHIAMIMKPFFVLTLRFCTDATSGFHFVGPCRCSYAKHKRRIPPSFKLEPCNLCLSLLHGFRLKPSFSFTIYNALMRLLISQLVTWTPVGYPTTVRSNIFAGDHSTFCLFYRYRITILRGSISMRSQVSLVLANP